MQAAAGRTDERHTMFHLANFTGTMDTSYAAEIHTDLHKGGRQIGRVSVTGAGQSLNVVIDGFPYIDAPCRRVAVFKARVDPADGIYTHNDVYGAINEALTRALTPFAGVKA